MRRTLTLVSTLLLTACGVGPASPEAVIDSRTHFLEGSAQERWAVEPGRLVLPLQGREGLLADGAGRIVVSGRDGGLLRRVDRAYASGGSLVLETSAAQLTDVVEDGDASPFRADDNQVVSGLAGALGFAQDLAHLPGGGRLELSERLTLTILEGKVDIRPTVDLDLSIRRRRVERFAFRVGGSAEAKVKVKVDGFAHIEAAYSEELWESPAKYVTFWIGPVPVVVAVRAIVTLDGLAKTGGHVSLTTSASAAGAIEGGLSYAAGSGWGTEASADLATPALTLEGKAVEEASLTAILGIRLDTKIYEAAGPWLTPVAAKTSAVAHGAPKCESVMTAGIQGMAGLSVTRLPFRLPGDGTISRVLYKNTLWELRAPAAFMDGCEGATSEPTPHDPQPERDPRTERPPTVAPAPSLPEPDPNAAAGYYRFLDDTLGVKRTPGDLASGLDCPVEATAAEAERLDTGERVTYRDSSAPIVVDASALDGLVDDDGLKLSLILVRRVDGVPHYRYLSNGRHGEIVQPWSATKFLAAANAGAALRRASGGQVGLDARVDGLPVSDLVSAMHAYDEQRFTSNSLGAWFHDIGGRAAANSLVHNGWLHRPAAETFGGNYGAASAALSSAFEGDHGAVTVSPDSSSGPANQLSMLTLSEALKRLVMHDADPATRLPGLTSTDAEILLDGTAGASRWYGSGDLQGMQADPSIYVQQALNMDALEAKSQGRWRIRSKMGHGLSRGGEFVHVAHACLPALDGAGDPVPDVGKELIIAAHQSADDDLVRGDLRLAGAYRTLLERVVDGRLK